MRSNHTYHCTTLKYIHPSKIWMNEAEKQNEMISISVKYTLKSAIQAKIRTYVGMYKRSEISYLDSIFEHRVAANSIKKSTHGSKG